MTPRYLLDTNVLSEPLAVKPSATVMAAIEEHQTEVATASVVWHELLFGARRLPKSGRRALIERYLDEVVAANVAVLPYDAPAAAWHAAERVRLSAIGLTPSFADGQIAAIAAVNDLMLVTRNAADFRHFKGIRVDNWFNA